MSVKRNDDINGGRPKMAGGIFIVLGLLLGIVFGIYTGEISLGMFAGFLIGSGIAILVWLIDRAKDRAQNSE